ncbi:MAG: biotin/lipoyl-binding protein, partial [Planctomycetota bacterium]|nr:biotin/lipoyl-binding protein [Planctomycetota bacterium]
PRTQDAAIRANLVGVAPHVSGPIVELRVVDNQEVSRGDVLFVVDPRPYQAALAEAEADLVLVDLEIEALRADVRAFDRTVEAARALVAQREAEAEYARIYLDRVRPLLADRFVTPDEVDKAQANARALQAAVATALADLAAAEAARSAAIAELGDLGRGAAVDPNETDARVAGEEMIREDRAVDRGLPGMDDGIDARSPPAGTRLNARRLAVQARVDRARLYVDYCTVRSPVDGYVTNLNLAVGEYANEGRQVFTLVDASIWYVMANFKETYTRYLEPGDPVEIYLMSRPTERLAGVVQGIGWAIDLADGATQDSTDLPRTDPTLDWVRLAQRFPVRIVIEGRPDASFRMGETAAVIALPGEDDLPPPRFPRVRAFFRWLGLDQ